MKLFLTQYKSNGVTLAGPDVWAWDWENAERLVRQSSGFPPGTYVVGVKITEIPLD